MAEVITNTILGVPYYKYSIMGPETLFDGPYITPTGSGSPKPPAPAPPVLNFFSDFKSKV